MMWAIFCSLAFCTFPIVFAGTLEDDIYISQDAATSQFKNVSSKEFDDVLAAAQAVKIEKMKWSQIFERCTLTDFDQRFVKSYVDKLPICDQCYLNVKSKKDIQTAETCCKKLLDELKKDATLFRAQAKACIANCAQDPTKCHEEFKNIEKKQLKEFENSSKGDDENV